MDQTSVLTFTSHHNVQWQVGLATALTATAGFSIMTIYTKKITEDVGIHTLRLLCTLGQLSALMLLPVWLFYDLPSILEYHEG